MSMQPAYDPFDTATFPYATFPWQGIRYSYVDHRPAGFDAQKPDVTPTVLCLHGEHDCTAERATWEECLRTTTRRGDLSLVGRVPDVFDL